jgi:hypothetical protein
MADSSPDRISLSEEATLLAEERAEGGAWTPKGKGDGGHKAVGHLHFDRFKALGMGTERRGRVT